MVHFKLLVRMPRRPRLSSLTAVLNALLLVTCSIVDFGFRRDLEDVVVVLVLPLFRSSIFCFFAACSAAFSSFWSGASHRHSRSTSSLYFFTIEDMVMTPWILHSIRPSAGATSKGMCQRSGNTFSFRGGDECLANSILVSIIRIIELGEGIILCRHLDGLAIVRRECPAVHAGLSDRVGSALPGRQLCAEVNANTFGTYEL